MEWRLAGPREGGGAPLGTNTGSNRHGRWLEVERSGRRLGEEVSSPDRERWRLGVGHREGVLPPAVFFKGSRSNPKGLVATAALQCHCARGFSCSTGRMAAASSIASLCSFYRQWRWDRSESIWIEEDEGHVCNFSLFFGLLCSLVRPVAFCILSVVSYLYVYCSMYFLDV